MNKVLIIEDDRKVIELLTDLLEYNNYEVITATNGKIGVEKAIEYLPDLIISDIMMPEMDGIEVLSHIRSNPTTFPIPFLFLTAKSDKQDIRTGMELGADDYITKPFKHQEILSAVKIRIDKYTSIKKSYESQIDVLRENISLSLPHELRTPLNGILGYSQIMRSEATGLTPDDIKLMAQSIYESGQRLLHIVENYTYYISLQNPVELANLLNYTSYSDIIIKETAESVASKYNRNTSLKFELADSAIRVSDEHLSKIIKELVDNACKFSYPNTDIQIKSTISCNNLLVSVSNFGRGLTTHEIDGIGAFTQFNRNQFEQQGLGLGLAIVKKLIEIYNGELRIDSAIEGNTTFFFNVPLLV